MFANKTNVSKYNEALQANADHRNILEKSDGEKMVKSMTEECRLGFGEVLEFDHSGERNITHGIKPSIRPYVQFNNNGMQKYMARRNHPRLIQQPYLSLFFGANNDTKLLLNGQFGKELLEKVGKEEYDRFTCNLIVAKMSCLEPGRCNNTLEEYLTWYACKGGETSKGLEEKLKVLTQTYCSKDNNQSKSLRSFMGKQMFKISNSMSLTRDQCHYMIAGGQLKQYTCETPMKCSITSMLLKKFSERGEHDNLREKKFTWANIVQKYKA